MNLESPCNNYVEVSWMFFCTCKVVFSLNIVQFIWFFDICCFVLHVKSTFSFTTERSDEKFRCSLLPLEALFQQFVLWVQKWRLGFTYVPHILQTNWVLHQNFFQLLFCYQSTSPCKVQSMCLAAKGHIHSTMLCSWHQRRQWNVDWPMVEFRVS